MTRKLCYCSPDIEYTVGYAVCNRCDKTLVLETGCWIYELNEKGSVNDDDFYRLREKPWRWSVSRNAKWRRMG